MTRDISTQDFICHPNTLIIPPLKNCPDQITREIDIANNKKLAMEDQNRNYTEDKNSTQIDFAEILSDPKADSQTTQLLLENVCNDFESIDVINYKNKPLISTPLEYKLNIINLCENRSTDPKNLSHDNQLITQDEIITSLCTETVPQGSSVFTINSGLNTSSDTDECRVLNNIAYYTDDTQLAELADAELVHSGNNIVSLVLTNPRFIEVDARQHCLEEQSSELNAVVELDTNEVVIEEHVCEIPASDYSSNIDNEVIAEVIPSQTQPIMKRKYNKLKNKLSTIKSNHEVGKNIRARRISSKMKADWSKQLADVGFITCPMPGCRQTYKAFANFVIHMKYCTGKKKLQHCLYCDSLIFTSQTAIIQHMSVEHPEKINEYSAKYPFENETSAFEEDSFGEGISNKSPAKKRKCYKENISFSPKKAILKPHKMKKIKETVIDNINEFKKCVRFNDIVSKINSFNKMDASNPVVFHQTQASKESKFFKSRKRLLISDDALEQQKYFSDPDDFNSLSEGLNSSFEISCDSADRINTKSKLVLNMERYRRYQEKLSLTRDWASPRRTYSRNRNLNNSLEDTSHVQEDAHIELEDIHQLIDSTESVHDVSVNTEENVFNEKSDLESRQSSLFYTPVSTFTKIKDRNKNMDNNMKQTVFVNTLNNLNNENIYQKGVDFNSLSSTTENLSIRRARRARTTCYDRASNRPTLLGIPDTAHKTDVQVRAPDFDSLVKNFLTSKNDVPNSQERKRGRPPKQAINFFPKNANKKTNVLKNKLFNTQFSKLKSKKHYKEDGVKIPSEFSFSLDKGLELKKKRGRGRPRKYPIFSDSNPKLNIQNSKKNSMKKNMTVTRKYIKIKKIAKGKFTNVQTANKKQKGLVALNRLVKTMKNKYKNNNLKYQRESSCKLLKGDIEKINKAVTSAKKESVNNESEVHNMKNVVKATPHNSNKLLNNFDHNVSQSCLEKKSVCDLPESSSTSFCLKKNGEIDLTSEELDSNKVFTTHYKQGNELSIETEVICDDAPDEINMAQLDIIEDCDANFPNSSSNISNNNNTGLRETLQKRPCENLSPKSMTVDHNYVSLDEAVNENNVLSKNLNSSEDVKKIPEKERDTTEVAPKRGRGRPKKVHSAEKSMVINKDSSATSENLTTGGKDTFHLVTENNAESLILRSKRIQKLNLTHYTHKKKEEDACLKKEKAEQSYPRKRGRPRKYPINIIEAKSLSVEKNSDFDSPENVRKCARKGRPRKYVRNLDLITHRHCSEVCEKTASRESTLKTKEHNLDNEVEVSNEGLHVKKRKKLKEENSQPLILKASEELLVKKSLNKKIVRNLKKKVLNTTMEIKKKEKLNSDDVLCEAKTNLLSTSHSRSKFNATGVKEKRNMKLKKSFSLKPVKKLYKNKYMQKLIKDAPHMHTKKRSTLSIKFPIKKRQRKRFVPCKNSPKVVSKANFMKKYISLNCNYELFPEFKPKKFMMKRLSEKDYAEYLPPINKSSFIKIINGKTKRETDWFSLKLYETAPLDKSPSCHCTFFTGGPIEAAKFCPTPLHVTAPQHLVIATSNSADSFHTYKSENAKGVLQVWDLGFLDVNFLRQEPKLRYCISYNHGITDIDFCPTGCWEDPKSISVNSVCDFDLPRLALLAVACSDSLIRIYSIPQPDGLNLDNSVYPPFYCSYPVALLRPSFVDSSVSETVKPTCTTVVTWQKTDRCECIAGGYGNGIICIWKVSGAAVLTKEKTDVQKTFQPFLTFQSHFGAPITGLSFGPFFGNRYLVSCSLDSLKFYDIFDSSMPLFTFTRGGNNVECSPKWCGAFVAFDDSLSISHSTSYKDCGFHQNHPRYLSSHNSHISSCSLSEWLNMQAVGDTSGEVTANLVKSLHLDHIKQVQEKRYPVFRTEVRCLQNMDVEKSMCFRSEEMLNEAKDHARNTLADVIDVVEGVVTAVDACINAKEIENVMNDLIDSTEKKIISSNSLLSDATNYGDQNAIKIDFPLFDTNLLHSNLNQSRENFVIDLQTEAEDNILPCLDQSCSNSFLTSEFCAANSDNETRASTAISSTCVINASEEFDVAEANLDKIQNTQTGTYCNNNNEIGTEDRFHQKEKSEISKEIISNSVISLEDIVCNSLVNITAKDDVIKNSNISMVSLTDSPKNSSISENMTYKSSSKSMLSFFPNTESRISHNDTVQNDDPEFTLPSNCELKLSDSISMEELSNFKKSTDIRTQEIYELSEDFSDSECVCADPNVCTDPECICKESFNNDDREREDIILNSSFNFRQVKSVDVGTDSEFISKGTKEKVYELSNESFKICSDKMVTEHLSKYEDLREKFGLVFKEFDLRNISDIEKSELNRLLDSEKMNTLPDDLHKLSSINTVTWNQNFGSHLWLFTASKSGICHLSCASGLNNVNERTKKCK